MLAAVDTNVDSASLAELQVMADVNAETMNEIESKCDGKPDCVKNKL